jgi:SAM-dependent methyltransferase
MSGRREWTVDMDIAAYLTRQRNRYGVDLKDREEYWSLSAGAWSGHECLESLARNYFNGTVLDVGAGSQNARPIIQKYASRYIGLDIANKTGEMDVLNDMQDMKDIEAGSIDVVYSAGALGYARKPERAVREIHRVLKPNGYGIVMAPFLNGIVDEPHHLFHYTPDGLAYLFKEAGFEVIEERRIGGIFCFLGHSVSYVLLMTFWGIPVAGWLVWWLNKILLVHPPVLLDKVLRLNRKFPMMVVIVGKKAAG